MIEEGHHTFAALLEAMYGQLPLADRFSALGMLVGYLDLLEADGLIKGRRDAGVLSFRVTT